MTSCPFEADWLTVGTNAIASKPEMLTAYLHESLFNSPERYPEGQHHQRHPPDLDFSMDLMAPVLKVPTEYAGEPLRIDIEVLSAPQVWLSLALWG